MSLQRVAEMMERLEEKETLCEQLRAKLKKYQAIEEAANTVKKFSLTDLKTKYETTRLQLIQQMNKTKDMVSFCAARPASPIDTVGCRVCDV